MHTYIVPVAIHLLGYVTMQLAIHIGFVLITSLLSVELFRLSAVIDIILICALLGFSHFDKKFPLTIKFMLLQWQLVVAESSADGSSPSFSAAGIGEELAVINSCRLLASTNRYKIKLIKFFIVDCCSYSYALLCCISCSFTVASAYL